jgi:hypothetical protein
MAIRVRHQQPACAPQVLPGAFMVTKPHGRAPTWRAAPGTARDAAQLERVARLYDRFKAELVSAARPTAFRLLF